MITVIIPHHLNQNQDLLDYCIDSVIKQDVEKEILVIADTLYEPRVDRYYNIKLHWFKNGEVNHFARKINMGVQLASEKSTHYMICSDDVILGKNVLRNLSNACGQNTIVNSLSNCDDINILKHNMFLKKETTYEEIKSPELRSFIHNLMGSDAQFVIPTNRLYFYATMIPKMVWERLGPLQTKFESGWEDEDYCLRAAMNGIHCAIDTSSYIFHLGAQTIKKLPKTKDNNNQIFKEIWGLNEVPPMTLPGFGFIAATGYDTLIKKQLSLKEENKHGS